MNPIVGNDVVDLASDEARTPHPRFDRRVFTPDEVRIVDRADDPHRTRWTLWAAKEAAYKVARKVAPDLRLPARRIEVGLDDGAVRAGPIRVGVTWSQGKDHVHALAVLMASSMQVCAAVREHDREDRGRESRRVRDLARRLLRGWGLEDAEIRRDGLGPPTIFRRGSRLPGHDVGLSHHGRYVAAVVARMQARAIRNSGAPLGSVSPS